MFIVVLSPFNADAGSPSRTLTRSDLDALDGEALEIGRRIFRIENLAVEEGLFAARRGRWNVRRGDVELLGGLFPKVLAVDLGDQRLGVEGRVILAPADILGDEPEVVALVRIARVVRPIPHDVRAVLDDLAGE